MTLERLAGSTSQSNEGSPRLQLGPSGWSREEKITGFVRRVQGPLQDVFITISTILSHISNIPALTFKKKIYDSISFAGER